MSCDKSARQRRLRIETVRGQPYSVGGRTLTPVARVVSFRRARGTIGRERIGGWGVAYARITPLAVVEESAGGERRVAIRDATTGALARLLAGAVAVLLFFQLIRRLARRARADRAAGV